MEKTTSEKTIEYIQEHPSIKYCLKKGLINYSSLSRHITKELAIEKTSSKEAILIAARRFKHTLQQENTNETKIKKLLTNSELDIKTKINVFILDKKTNPEELYQIEKKIRKENTTFILLEGTDNFTLITQEKNASFILTSFKNNVLKNHTDLAMINFKSPKDIEHTIGVISYLTSLFSENNINITELISCWTETTFIIHQKDLTKAINLLHF